MHKSPKEVLHYKHTNWGSFHKFIDSKFQIKRPRSSQEIEDTVSKFTLLRQEAAKQATLTMTNAPRPVTTPTEIRRLVIQKCKACRIWHRSRLPEDKTILNKLTHNLTRKISEFKNQSFKSYVSQCGSTAKTDYTFWKACLHIRSPQLQTSPIRTLAGIWVRSDTEIANTFAKHLESTFVAVSIVSLYQTNQPRYLTVYLRIKWHGKLTYLPKRKKPLETTF